MERTTRQALDRCLLQVVDGSLAGVIFFVPLLMGGRHALGQLVLTSLAVVAAWAWAIRQCLRDDAAWRPTWAAPLLLAGLALVALQVVPLPPWLLARLAPRTADLLPLWSDAAETPALLGHWPYLSFTPAETLAGLVVLLDYALLFLVTAQRIRHIEDVERLLRWCALSAVGMASFGMVQLLTSNGKFFWFYEHPFADTLGAAKGSFSNRNHFAQFLALGIGPLIWWLQDALYRVRTRSGGPGRLPAANLGRAELKMYFLGLALGIVLFAGLLSLSRGGITAMFLAAAIGTAVSYRASSLSGRFVAVLAAAGLLIGASLSIFGYDRVSHRLDDLSSGSLDRLDHSAARRTIWAAAAKAIPDAFPLGTGVGSFHEVYPRYTDALPDDDLEYTHAENCPLQEAVETGAAGLALTLAGIVLCFSWCIRGVRSSTPLRSRVCAAAIAGSLAAATAHATVDFVWYVPACMAMAAMLAACALRVEQLSRGERSEPRRTRNEARSSLAAGRSPPALPRFSWAFAAAVLAWVGGWMIVSSTGPALAQLSWDEYVLAHRAAPTPVSATRNAALADSEAQQWLACLENVVHWQPTHLGAHLALAETHRRLFDALQRTTDNPMSLADVRDAAIKSQFPSREALVDWLSRAVGKHWVHLERALYHTRQALMLCPLQGRAYVYLAQLSFLFGANDAGTRACVEQALRVRPFDGAVLSAAADEAIRAGDAGRWLDYSQRAFRRGRRQQQQLIGDLVASTPTDGLPAVIEFIIRDFQPDLEGLRLLHGACLKRCPAEQLAPLVLQRAEKAEVEATALPPAKAAQVWLEAQQLYSQLRHDADALKCARSAVQSDPGNYDVHCQLALCLLNQRLFAEAEWHLRWCLQRMPNNQVTEGKLREALKGRLDGQRRAAAEGERLIAR